MTIRTKYILSIISILIFLFLYPYTKEVPVFKSDDVAWSVFINVKTVKEFNYENFSFSPSVSVNEEVEEMNNKNIEIKGFISIHKHDDKKKILLSEKISGVCFMCNHDENYISIEIVPKNKESEIFNLKPEEYVKVAGKFVINEETEHFKFSIINAVLTKKFRSEKE